MTADIEVRDNGKTISEMRVQLNFAADIWQFNAGLADKIEGAFRPVEKPDPLALTVREPVAQADASHYFAADLGGRGSRAAEPQPAGLHEQPRTAPAAPPGDGGRIVRGGGILLRGGVSSRIWQKPDHIWADLSHRKWWPRFRYLSWYRWCGWDFAGHERRIRGISTDATRLQIPDRKLMAGVRPSTSRNVQLHPTER
jgi:hypothetical protein